MKKARFQYVCLACQTGPQMLSEAPAHIAAVEAMLAPMAQALAPVATPPCVPVVLQHACNPGQRGYAQLVGVSIVETADEPAPAPAKPTIAAAFAAAGIPVPAAVAKHEAPPPVIPFPARKRAKKGGA